MQRMFASKTGFTLVENKAILNFEFVTPGVCATTQKQEIKP
jgi:hypothetical protein